jgi:hypothetical protein
MKRKILTQFIITHYREYTCGIQGGTTLTSFKKDVDMKRLIAVAWQAWQFPRISVHQMMAE